MKEYIEREAARDLFEQALVDDWEIQYADDRLDEIPAADVVEVRHGRWVYNDELDDMFHCTVCDAVSVRNTFRYCPNCGAKMDGGADTDEPIHT
jgi:hypothetical protein